MCECAPRCPCALAGPPPARAGSADRPACASASRTLADVRVPACRHPRSRSTHRTYTSRPAPAAHAVDPPAAPATQAVLFLLHLFLLARCCAPCCLSLLRARAWAAVPAARSVVLRGEPPAAAGGSPSRGGGAEGPSGRPRRGLFRPVVRAWHGRGHAVRRALRCFGRAPRPQRRARHGRHAPQPAQPALEGGVLAGVSGRRLAAC
jgi:hypothetical protein